MMVVMDLMDEDLDGGYFGFLLLLFMFGGINFVLVYSLLLVVILLFVLVVGFVF